VALAFFKLWATISIQKITSVISLPHFLNNICMFSEIDLIDFFGPALLIASLVLLIMVNLRNKKDIPVLNKVIDHFKITSIVFGVLLIILWLALPSTPALKSFGYPKDVSAIKMDKDMLRLLQDYNKAIVRTTEVLQWFLFLFTWWFLSTLFGVANAYKSGKQRINN